MSFRARLSTSMRSLRLLVPQKPEAARYRSFINKNLPELMLLNPGLHLVVREGGEHCQMIATFDAAREVTAVLDNMNEDQIFDKIKEFVNESVQKNYLYYPRGINDDILKNEDRNKVQEGWIPKYWN